MNPVSNLKTTKGLLVFAVFILVLVLNACDTGLSSLGPGTGGTGPLGSDDYALSASASSSSEYLIAMDTTSKNDVISTPSADGSTNTASDGMSSISKLPESDTDGNRTEADIIAPSKVPEPEQLSVIITNSSSATVQCGSLIRQFSLMANDTAVNQAWLRPDAPIEFKLVVKNTANSEMTETRRNCSSFELLDEAGNDILEKQATCNLAQESMTYQPAQTHTYNVKLEPPKISGVYSIVYTNTLDGYETKDIPCTTALEFQINTY